jgi:hypothetical protein
VDNHIELPLPFNMMREISKGVSVKEAILQGMNPQPLQADNGIAVWPELGNNWLKKILNL